MKSITLWAAIMALAWSSGSAWAGTTTHYGWATPTIGSDENTWGATLNNLALSIDAQLKVVQNIADGTTALENPSAWQKYSSGAIGTASGSLGINLPNCKAIKIIIQGVLPTIGNSTLSARIAYDQVPNIINLSGYSSAGNYQKTDATSGTFGNAGQSSITISPVGLGNASGLIQGLEMTILNPNGQTLMLWSGMFLDVSGNYVKVDGGGRVSGGTAISYIQFNLSVGVYSPGGSYVTYCNPHL